MDWLTTILSYVPQTAIPIVVVAIAYLKINSDRKNTKEIRDKDSLELHDKMLKHDFLIGQLKDNYQFMRTVLDDLRDTTNNINLAICKLDSSVNNLTDTVKELKQQ
jgi:hypothetical protein